METQRGSRLLFGFVLMKFRAKFCVLRNLTTLPINFTKEVTVVSGRRDCVDVKGLMFDFLFTSNHES